MLLKRTSKILHNLTTIHHRNFKAAVILSGCGVYDGSEITESVSTLIALSKHGASYTIYAPNRD